jgi:hypothetical protein
MEQQQNAQQLAPLGFNKQRDRQYNTYFHIFDYSLCQKSNVHREGWEGPIVTHHPRTGEPKETWVERYDSIVAYIINCDKFNRSFDNGGNSMGFELTLLAGEQKALLTLEWIKPATKRFLKVARNIDFSKPVRISVFMSKSSTTPGKVGTGISFKQDVTGTIADPEQWPKVEEYWGRDRTTSDPQAIAQGYCPDAVQDGFTGKWDYSAQESFLGRDFQQYVMPVIKEVARQYGIVDQQEAQQQQVQTQQAPQQPPVDNRAMMNAARQNFNQQAQQPQQQQAPPQQFAPPPVNHAINALPNMGQQAGQVVQQGQFTPPAQTPDLRSMDKDWVAAQQAKQPPSMPAFVQQGQPQQFNPPPPDGFNFNDVAPQKPPTDDDVPF